VKAFIIIITTTAIPNFLKFHPNLANNLDQAQLNVKCELIIPAEPISSDERQHIDMRKSN